MNIYFFGKSSLFIFFDYQAINRNEIGKFSLKIQLKKVIRGFVRLLKKRRFLGQNQFNIVVSKN